MLCYAYDHSAESIPDDSAEEESFGMSQALNEHIHGEFWMSHTTFIREWISDTKFKKVRTSSHTEIQIECSKSDKFAPDALFRC